jgi:hypothetical protein
MSIRDEVIQARKDGKSWSQIYAMYPNSGQTTLRNYAPKVTPEKIEQTQADPPSKSSVSDEILSDGSQRSTRILEMLVDKKYTPDELLMLHGFDPPEKWELLSAVSNAWNGMTGRQLNNELVELRQSKVHVKPRKNELTLEDIKQVFHDLSINYTRPKVNYPAPQGSTMAEVNIADLHLGKLCWHGDTPMDYDYKIARDSWNQIVGDICTEICLKPIEKILFVVCNDFFNSDNPQKTTTLGTPQDTDIRWQKLYRVGIEMLHSAILLLADIAPVEMPYTASNHDKTTMYYAMCHLADSRHIDPKRVSVDTDAYPRKYRLYGNTLLGIMHGDTEKKQGRSALGALAPLPSIEARELWGKAKYVEVHAHHLHCEQAIDEVNGVTVRRISSPTAYDTWHTESGYVGAVRKAQTFLYDKEYGLVHTINTPVR